MSAPDDNHPIGQHIRGLYETHIPVRDLEQSVMFYRDILGLQLARSIPERNVAFFWVGNRNQSMLGLWGSGSAPMGMRLHYAFRSDLNGVLSLPEKLRQAGQQPLGFNGEPIEEPVVIGWMPAVSIYLKDPDGHSLEFLSILDETPDSDFGVRSYSDWITNRTKDGGRA
ncbi:VOC family protein [Parasedimentitalea huanghaiensis]|uniref:VOC family protein n=1 Tax=Parasedimentitalea huanghaiensis TaxID=2682100 RepID=A0A6L6WEW9_9RHOB|nr:VOC family protein [Zongyanglinia huanghaiensis]MVO16396.1 VOC family protein [Zongyanglinia huanghaiensis]